MRNPMRSGQRLLEANGKSISLAIERVSFSYDGSIYVLDGLDFLIEPGDHVAVVGPSRCGKSTLVRLIARFFDPVYGRILINGVDARELSVRYIRRAVAILPQSPGFLNATIGENIAFYRNVPPAAVERAGARAVLDPELLAGLHSRTVGQAGESLSGGQRQRIAPRFRMFKTWWRTTSAPTCAAASSPMASPASAAAHAPPSASSPSPARGRGVCPSCNARRMVEVRRATHARKRESGAGRAHAAVRS